MHSMYSIATENMYLMISNTYVASYRPLATASLQYTCTYMNLL